MVLELIGEAHFDEGLVGHVAFVGLDLDGFEQGGGHAQGNGFGGELQLGQRDTHGLGEVEMVGAVGGFMGNLKVGGFSWCSPHPTGIR